MINVSQMDRLEKAIVFATHAHRNQVRRNNQELYINHPLRVMYNIRENIFDSICLSASILHDVVEDTEYTIEDIKREFGQDVANLVDILTKKEDSTLTYMEYIQSIIDTGNVYAMIIKFYDAHDNSIWDDGVECRVIDRYMKVKKLLQNHIIFHGYRYVIEKHIQI